MIKYICDGCKREQDAVKLKDGRLVKPFNWFERVDQDGEQHACCRDCISKIAKSTGKTEIVLPF